MAEDIIAARATPWGEGGIAIVRISGSGSVELADKIFRGAKKLAEHEPRRLVLGKLIDGESVAFDEALAVRFEDRAAYTGEESVEIHCHGGAIPAQKCVEQACALGARLAEPGEFTRRAFTNGRIDLSQAEAVIGIIRSKSDEALRASARTLQGEFAAEIKKLLADLTEFAAKLEVDLDFPEEGEGLLSCEEREKIFSEITGRCETLLEKSRSGLMLREGIHAAIAGRPNAGKSSLLNAFLRKARAIVTDVPGTTRDRIEETLTHRGIPIRIIDTAGIRDTSDEVESIGVRQSVESIEGADIRLWVVDGAQGVSGEEIEMAASFLDKPHIIVLNKQDLPQKTDTDQLKKIFPKSPIAAISALRSEGVEELKDMILDELSAGGHTSDGYSVTSRQMESLRRALDSINEARHAMSSRMGDDVVISCVAGAREELSSLLGLDASEELLDAIFSGFCVGK